MSVPPPRSVSPRTTPRRSASHRALLALPVAALLVAAGCGTGTDDGQAAAEQTVTATVTAPAESTEQIT